MKQPITMDKKCEANRNHDKIENQIKVLFIESLRNHLRFNHEFHNPIWHCRECQPPEW